MVDYGKDSQTPTRRETASKDPIPRSTVWLPYKAPKRD
jgi:hypothetical protein